jgi:hypothetical protein
MKLYDILENHRSALEAWCEDDETPAECWADTLEGIEGEFEDKARAYIAVILELEADEDAGMAAAKKITASAKAKGNRAAYLRANLLTGLQSIGKTEIKFAEFCAKLPKPKPSLKIDDADSVPAMYKTTSVVVTIDNAFLKQQLVDGVEIEGAHLEFKQTITIK